MYEVEIIIVLPLEECRRETSAQSESAIIIIIILVTATRFFFMEPPCLPFSVHRTEADLTSFP